MYKIPAKTLFIGKKINFLPTCHSTNDEAAGLVDKHQVIEGTVVITDNQLSGKGQRGNSWHAQPGKNLTFSLILKPSFLSIVHQFNLNMAISLGITDYLNTIRPGFQVKWPNDIYFSDKKLGGILIQNMLKGASLTYSIVGIGLNVNQLHFDEPRAISLAQVIDEMTDLNLIFERICESIEYRYLQLKRGDIAQIRKDYLGEMYRFGEDHLYESDTVFQGRITGVSEQGLLELETNKGLRLFNFKEISFLS